MFLRENFQIGWGFDWGLRSGGRNSSICMKKHLLSEKSNIYLALFATEKLHFINFLLWYEV
jgi:hypothetical protein